jgi:hypothetical protein
LQFKAKEYDIYGKDRCIILEKNKVDIWDFIETVADNLPQLDKEAINDSIKLAKEKNQKQQKNIDNADMQAVKSLQEVWKPSPTGEQPNVNFSSFTRPTENKETPVINIGATGDLNSAKNISYYENQNNNNSLNSNANVIVPSTEENKMSIGNGTTKTKRKKTHKGHKGHVDLSDNASLEKTLLETTTTDTNVVTANFAETSATEPSKNSPTLRSPSNNNQEVGSSIDNLTTIPVTITPFNTDKDPKTNEQSIPETVVKLDQTKKKKSILPKKLTEFFSNKKQNTANKLIVNQQPASNNNDVTQLEGQTPENK